MNAVEKESRICIPNQQGEEGDDVCACVCVCHIALVSGWPWLHTTSFIKNFEELEVRRPYGWKPKVCVGTNDRYKHKVY